MQIGIEPKNEVGEGANLKLGLKIALILSILLGSFITLSIALHIKPNSDHATITLYWYGLHQYGWKFLKSWVYNPHDNWLSLLPLHALIYSITPPSIEIIMLSGAVIFVLTVLGCSLIAGSIRAQTAALVAPILLMFPNSICYHFGYIIDPISHNISNLYGIACISCAVLWIKKGNIAALFLLSCFTIVSGISDPWFLSAYGLPILFASIILSIVTKQSLIVVRRCKLLLAAMLVSALLIGTKLFGLFSFLPSMAFSFAHWHIMFYQFNYLIINVGRLFNIVPGYGAMAFASWISLVTFSTLLSILVLSIRRRFLWASPEALLCLLIILCSILMSSLFFCCYANSVPYPSVNADLQQIRYFLNLYFLIILGIAIIANIYWNYFSLKLKLFLLSVVLLYATASISSTAPLVLNDSLNSAENITDNSYSRLVSFLTKNDLRYGYADFGIANIGTVISQNHIQIRPVTIKNLQVNFKGADTIF